MAGKKQNVAPVWKKLMKILDTDEPTSFFVHVYLACIQRECKPNEMIIEERMFESHFSAGALDSTILENRHAKTVALSCDREGNARACVRRYCELAYKKFWTLTNPHHFLTMYT